MAVQPNIIADFETQLSAPLAIGDTSLSLASILDDDGNTIPNGLYFFTIDNGTASKEYVAVTKSGSNFTGLLHITRQGTQTAGTTLAHRVGASVVMTDFLTYKAYLDNATLSGAIDASLTQKGIVELATQAELLAKTATGSTGAALAVTPNILPSTLLSDYKADTGAANAYAITPAPAITAYTVGQVFSFKATNANTLASTINVNGLGVKTIKKNDGATDLVSGDIRAGQIVVVEYDGTNFQMISPLGNAPSTVDIQVFTASGTWTKPANAKFIVVLAIGAGGGGALGTGNPAGGGGGGGGFSVGQFYPELLSPTVAITIGAGGAAGVAGGNTTFGALLTAGGGGGASGATGGTAGSTTGGVAGGVGGAGGSFSSGNGSAGGGAAAGNGATGNGAAGGAGLGLGGAGGAASANSALLGAGGMGGSSSGGVTTGVAGSIYGGGGGGSTTSAAAGVGAAGYLRVTTYF